MKKDLSLLQVLLTVHPVTYSIIYLCNILYNCMEQSFPMSSRWNNDLLVIVTPHLGQLEVLAECLAEISLPLHKRHTHKKFWRELEGYIIIWSFRQSETWGTCRCSLEQFGINYAFCCTARFDSAIEYSSMYRGDLKSIPIDVNIQYWKSLFKMLK